MSGVLRKVYHGVALLALLNLAVVGGSIGYLAATGQLTVERVERAADALRGDWPVEPDARTEAEAAAPPGSTATLEQDGGEDEVTRLRADRRRAELQQQMSIIAAARLEVTRQREALERRYDEIRSQAKQREQQEESEGFQKELDLLSSVKPKVAVGYLLEKPREDAAALLLAMETRKGKRLVEAAKTVSQQRAMADVLEMLREMSPEQADLLNQSQR